MAPRLRPVKVGQRSSEDQKRRGTSRNFSPRTVGAIQGNSQVQINDGSFNLVGGDSYTYIQFPATDVAAELKLALRAIPNFRKIHQDTLAKATPGTGMWLIKSEKFWVWLEGNGNIKIFWGFGIPGAGKTILAAIVIDYLEKRAKESRRQICIAYVYIRFSDRDQVTVRSILEILVKQVVERHADYLPLVEKAYARHLREGTQPTEGELLQLLRRLAERMAATFYILDAIDEAPDKIRLDLVKKLSLLPVRLFITSRPLPAISSKVPGSHAFSVVANDQDLDLHIAEKLEGAPALQYLIQEHGEEFKEQIVSTVKSKCGGIFLHASLQLDALQQCSTSHEVLETLEGFPVKIEDVYKQTWDRIIVLEPNQGALAKAALVWVLNAQRSMTIDELRHALATSPSTFNFDSTRLMPEAAFVAIFRGLIVIDKTSKLVRLVHKTARRPLEQLLKKSFPDPHSHLAAVCMTHLADRGFQNTSIASQEEFEQTLQADPLLAYAHTAWAFHAQQSLEVESTAIRIASFVAGCQAFPVLVNHGISDFDLLSPLHLVAFFNLPLSCTGHNDADDPNIPTKAGGHRPLGLACWRGNQELVHSLLDLSNIYVNETDNDGVSALMWAASAGHIDLVELLLARLEVNVNLLDREGWSALLKATANGRESVVERLLAHPDISANLTSETERGFALTWAAGKGYKSIIEMFLARSDMHVNLVDSEGRTALIWAASNGHDSTVDFLLSQPDVDVNWVDNEGCSAIIKAAMNGRKTIVERLLAHAGIDANIADLHGTTALLAACRIGHVEIVKLLLAVPGIDVNPFDDEGNTALKAADEQGCEEIVRMLLEAPGIDVRAVSFSDGRTALAAALAMGREGVAHVIQVAGSGGDVLALCASPTAEDEYAPISPGGEAGSASSDDEDIFEDAMDSF